MTNQLLNSPLVLLVVHNLCHLCLQIERESNIQTKKSQLWWYNKSSLRKVISDYQKIEHTAVQLGIKATYNFGTIWNCFNSIVTVLNDSTFFFLVNKLPLLKSKLFLGHFLNGCKLHLQYDTQMIHMLYFLLILTECFEMGVPGEKGERKTHLCYWAELQSSFHC